MRETQSYYNLGIEKYEVGDTNNGSTGSTPREKRSPPDYRIENQTDASSHIYTRTFSSPPAQSTAFTFEEEEALALTSQIVRPSSFSTSPSPSSNNSMAYNTLQGPIHKKGYQLQQNPNSSLYPYHTLPHRRPSPQQQQFSSAGMNPLTPSIIPGQQEFKPDASGGGRLYPTGQNYAHQQHQHHLIEKANLLSESLSVVPSPVLPSPAASKNRIHFGTVPQNPNQSNSNIHPSLSPQQQGVSFQQVSHSLYSEQNSKKFSPGDGGDDLTPTTFTVGILPAPSPAPGSGPGSERSELSNSRVDFYNSGSLVRKKTAISYSNTNNTTPTLPNSYPQGIPSDQYRQSGTLPASKTQVSG